MGKYLNLRPIAQFEKSTVTWIESNFRAIAAAISTMRASDIGAADTGHTHTTPVEAFITPVYTNSWTTFAGHSSAAYYKDPFGRVHLRGSITGGTMNQAAFTLPVGYRPLSTIFHASSSVSSLDVNSSGEVKPTVGSSSDIFGINFSFRAEQ